MVVLQAKYKGGLRDLGATEDNELVVRAIQETELEHASSKGDSYSWTSSNSDIAAGETRLLIKNNSDKFLVLSRGNAEPANVVCTYNIGIGSDTTTLAGTEITAVNMNQKFSTQAEAYEAFDDETGLADASILQSVTCSTTESKEFPLDGIILGKGHYIQINQETEATSGRITVFGHFETEAV